jgi:hypothetical protein
MKKVKSRKMRKTQKGGGFVDFVCRNFCKHSKSKLCTMLCDNTPPKRNMKFTVVKFPKQNTTEEENPEKKRQMSRNAAWNTYLTNTFTKEELKKLSPNEIESKINKLNNIKMKSSGTKKKLAQLVYKEE